MISSKPGRFLVEQRRFVVMHPQTNMPITPQNWSTSVVPGVSLDMFVFVERLCSQSTKFLCPRCDHLIVTFGLKCLLSSVTLDGARLGISSDSSSSAIPVPLLNLYTGTRGMDSEDRDPETHRRFRGCETLACHLIELPGPFRFCRVHVIPFEGNLSRSVVRNGIRYRDVILSYVSNLESKNPRLTPETVVGFQKLMQELNELKATAQVVYHPIHDSLFQDRVSHDEIWGIAQWMPSPPRLDLTPTLSELGSSSFSDEY
ncbi:hypothetical protein LB506_005613 [Fusarium annulatum]|nr:hypothetical protein LB506_005613 [Fusarium annulatum]